ncbi:uncharacterized protein F4822DRAFT_383679 [Hypoxylon trugodes]|uniref:uncharacterized protein n=1 Tax=Hypoxylon trugodes TaxID=326681 RepID=UPI00219653D6|nr:uncharacterized protein F4822DRAFT_383679 [Hypoxylon trugodes]KAI1393153.1 hypothetical protein F4822DRAFT_383679 [Hypoxylon trugodes]
MTTEISSTTVSTVFKPGTSYEAVDVWIKPPGQSTFIFSTEDWNTFTTTATSFTSSSTSQTTTSASSSASSTQATSLPVNNAQVSQTGSGLSSGAIAGIAIACAFAGLIMGVAAGFLLFRKRRQQPSEARYHVASTEYDGQEKALQSVLSTDRLHLYQFLLDTSPDAEINTELQSLNQLLQQHVEDHYHTEPVSRSITTLSAALINLGIDEDARIPASKLASLALDPVSRYSAIQHVIAKVAFGSVAFDDGPTTFSLLPQPISSFASMVPATEAHTGNPEAVDIALTRWRQLSAFLLHPSRSDRTPLAPSESVSTHRAQQLALSLNSFLEPFVAGDRQDRYEQENHLREVIVECATFGYLIFSQPSEYRFRFDSGVRPDHIVIFPGLDRISDEEGHRYPPPAQPVAIPVVEHM